MVDMTKKVIKAAIRRVIKLCADSGGGGGGQMAGWWCHNTDHTCWARRATVSLLPLLTILYVASPLLNPDIRLFLTFNDSYDYEAPFVWNSFFEFNFPSTIEETHNFFNT